ncbi:hypothetical protein CAEBREN_20690 [Caenorhabditis brenneri]|uniref:C6 domain-containing protein n=1 Tax=Caenorhabditis brenneri TaxID=135651 RepID=G0MN23_CAEBE|nr:hypothetical protein CAEBREN_20690 [Caenorhabditis brenneri]
MTKTIFLLSTLLIAGWLVGNSEQKCCSYPITSIWVQVNGTAKEVCAEPLHIECAVSGAIGDTPVVAIAGYPDKGNKSSYDIITVGNYSIGADLNCNLSTNYWKPEGSEKNYELFACAYQAFNGWYIPPE